MSEPKIYYGQWSPEMTTDKSPNSIFPCCGNQTEHRADCNEPENAKVEVCTDNSCAYCRSVDALKPKDRHGFTISDPAYLAVKQELEAARESIALLKEYSLKVSNDNVTLRQNNKINIPEHQYIRSQRDLSHCLDKRIETEKQLADAKAQIAELQEKLNKSEWGNRDPIPCTNNKWSGK